MRAALFAFFCQFSLIVMPCLAHAQETGPQEPSALAGLLPIILIAAVFYLLIIRPQTKRMKEHAQMTSTLKKGDEIVTGGGVVAKVTQAKDGEKTIKVEIAKGIEVEVLRSTITDLASHALTDPRNQVKPANENAEKSKGQKKKASK